jgi:3-deoxy-manno-octulosonate cytidylyltransferase (CMP-KDO synthetase)
MAPRVLGVIPARLGSERLPNKPLHPILGRPLLAWVWDRVSEFSILDHVVVATDHPSVVSLCLEMGAPVLLTDPAHPSGTDRVAEVARSPLGEGYDIVVNLQGDEPLMEESHVASAVALVRDGPWSVGTCATPILTAEAFAASSAVKVVRSDDGGALYFSRAPIPHLREGMPSDEMLAHPPFLRHIGVYAYQKDALLRWVALPPSPLEQIERLEQLRALEARIPIGVAVVSAAAPGVDTLDDALRIEARLHADFALNQRGASRLAPPPSILPPPLRPVDHASS